MHVNVTARFLTCEPNLAGLPDYTDEADLFYQNPERWLRAEYPGLLTSVERPAPPGGPPPSHLVMFDSLWRRLEPLVRGYRVCGDVFHAHVAEERRGGRMMVLCRDGWAGTGE